MVELVVGVVAEQNTLVNAFLAREHDPAVGYLRERSFRARFGVVLLNRVLRQTCKLELLHPLLIYQVHLKGREHLTVALLVLNGVWRSYACLWLSLRYSSTTCFGTWSARLV